MAPPGSPPPGSPGPGEPAQGPDPGQSRFDLAWEQIVADLTSGPDAIGVEPGDLPGPSALTTAPDDDAPPSSPGGAGGEDRAARDRHGPGDDQQGGPSQRDSSPTGTSEGLARLFEPLRRQDPGTRPPGSGPGSDQPSTWNPKDWADEGHYVPPPPPDLPEGTPTSRLAWAGTLGGPAILIGAAFTGYDLPRVVAIAAGLAALAGFATLIWLLPDSRPDSGWDDGAEV